MTKICHVTSAHNSNDSRIFYKECTSLAKAGYDTYLVARGESREENGVHIIGVGQPSGGRISRMTGFASRVYEKAVEIDADIYHLHDPELLPFGMKLKRKGKKVIFDSHENTLHQMKDKAWIPKAFRYIVDRAYTRYAVNVFRKMDALISVTPHIVDELKTINSKTYQIANFPMLSSEMAPDGIEKSSGFCICFTGGIDKQWSHPMIISAISHIEGARYVLCGPANKDYMEQLSHIDGWEKTDYRGIVPHEEAISIQRASTVGWALLQPSNNTGGNMGTMGNTKLFEYMMNGLPVICTDFELWKDIIDKYHCGICVRPQDEAAVENAIRYLYEHADVVSEMGRSGRKAVEQEFNWSVEERKLLDLYESINRERITG